MRFSNPTLTLTRWAPPELVVGDVLDGEEGGTEGVRHLVREKRGLPGGNASGELSSVGSVTSPNNRSSPRPVCVTLPHFGGAPLAGERYLRDCRRLHLLAERLRLAVYLVDRLVRVRVRVWVRGRVMARVRAKVLG